MPTLTHPSAARPEQVVSLNNLHPSCLFLKRHFIAGVNFFFLPAMWSGRFVHLTQSWNNYKCLDANATTWMDLLERNGYHTKIMGKTDYTSGSHSLRSVVCSTVSFISDLEKSQIFFSFVNVLNHLFIDFLYF